VAGGTAIVGYSTYAHALTWRESIVWHRDDGSTTVLPVKSIKTLKVEGAEPFYRQSSPGGRDADFTHVAVYVKGIPWPLMFDAEHRNVLAHQERFNGD
jgi:hypothetical protein